MTAEDTLAMIQRCDRAQHPEAYGEPEIPEPSATELQVGGLASGGFEAMPFGCNAEGIVPEPAMGDPAAGA